MVQVKCCVQKKECVQCCESMDIDIFIFVKIFVFVVGDKMDVDDDKKVKMEEFKDKKEEIGVEREGLVDFKKKVEKEKVGYEVENMFCVFLGQFKYISFLMGCYKFVKKVCLFV